MNKILVGVVVMSLLSGCATFNARVNRSDLGQINSREQVAGTTLSCAAASQRGAVWSLVLSAIAASTSGLLASASSNAAIRGDITGADTLGILSALSSGVSFGANIAAWINFGRSIAYTDRAGEVLAGLSMQGCNDGAPLPAAVGLPAESAPSSTSPLRPRATPSSPVPPASAQGRCSEKDVSDMQQGGMSSSAIERACAP